MQKLEVLYSSTALIHNEVQFKMNKNALSLTIMVENVEIFKDPTKISCEKYNSSSDQSLRLAECQTRIAGS